MKGGQLDENTTTDKKIYWRKIYSLSVTKMVLSDDPADLNTTSKSYRFEVQLTGKISGSPSILAEEFTGVYGGMNFINGKATFSIHNGETKVADLLPLGFEYTVRELLSTEMQGHFKTSAENDAGDVSQQKDDSGYPYTSGEMITSTKFNYQVTFHNLHAVCKIVGVNTNSSGNEQRELLYVYDTDTAKYIPAVYSTLVTAFNRVNAGDSIEWFYKDESGRYDRFYPESCSIEMLVPNYEMTEATSLLNNQKATLTTAAKDADDGFPYVGGRNAAVITRQYNGDSMITVSSGELTLGRITLDGNGTAHTVSCDGGLVKVNSGASLTVGDDVTLQNAKITSNKSGAAVYLAQGSKMYISGGPKFENNNKAMNLGTNTNGEETAYYTNGAPQDIFIAGYGNTTADSLVVTGDITSGPGSIAVWANEQRHYKQSKQFAVMQDGPHDGLNAFRNAQTDSQTENPLKTDPKYLYGIRRGNDGKVYWSGSMDLTIRKVVAGDFALPEDSFTFTVSGLDNGGSYDFTRYTSTNGTNWNQANGQGATGTLTADSSGNATFTLRHHEGIVISIPGGTSVTVSESNYGYYTPSYVLGSNSSVRNNQTGTITMDNDVVVTFTNTLNAASPTGVSFRVAPFALMMVFGLLLFLAGKRRRNEAD